MTKSQHHMENFSKAIIGLDLTEMDDIILQYTKDCASILGLDKVYLTHIAKNLELSEDLAKKYPDLLAPVDEHIERELTDKANRFFEGTSVEVSVHVDEGDPMSEILRLAKIKGIDLLIMGHKDKLPGSGNLSNKLAEKAPASVLFVTEQPNPKIQTIAISLDFSSHSSLALQQAMAIGKRARSKIAGIHVYEVPSGYHKTGKNYHEFAEIMKINAEEDFESFLKKNKLPKNEFPCHYVLQNEENRAKLIFKEVSNQKADLIVIGSKGRTAAASILLGSTAEKLSRVDHSVPLLIVKKKNENLSFIEALLRI